MIGQDNQILSDGTWNYSYDADGNRIGKVNIADGDAWVYTYDDANRLTSATETRRRRRRTRQGHVQREPTGSFLDLDASWEPG